MKNNLLYESFNAKNIPNDQISQSFIANEEFFQIAKDNHTLVMGPRGCGKTTMFKMLTTAALNNWNPSNIRERNIKSNKLFIAVYIPADEIWKEQLDQIKFHLSDKKTYWDKIKNAIFCTNVFLSFTKTIISQLHFENNTNRAIETDLAYELIRAFKLQKDVTPDLKNILKELDYRFQEIYLLYENIMDGEQVEFEEFYKLNFLKSISPVCIAFDNIFNKSNTRWALCFDECELIPNELFQNLLQQLRAVPEKFIFKLSTAPSSGFELFKGYDSSTLGKKGHDYDTINMWPDNHNKNERYRIFCGALAKQRVERIFFKKYNKRIDINLNDIFGEQNFSTVLEKKKSLHPDNNGKSFRSLIKTNKKYEKGSFEWIVIKEYAFIDEKFRRLLVERKIDPNNPSTDVKNRDEIYRKVFEILVFRLVFNKYNIQGDDSVNITKSGGNTNFKMYHGLTTLLSIVDGNPRYLIGLIDDFTPHIKYDVGNDKIAYISYKIQNTIYERASKKLFNKFKSVPLIQSDNLRNANNREHISTVIQTIGDFFNKRILKDPISLDPPSCFSIDTNSNRDEYLLNQIKTGLYLGAFISLPLTKSNHDIFKVDLKNERFRLTHLLAPHFSLPIRQYKSVSLSSCLNKGQNDNSGESLKLNFEEE